MDAIFIIGVIGVAFGILATYLLLRKAIVASRMLDFLPPMFTFCLFWQLLVSTLIESGVIIQFPHFIRTAIPLAFFLGPILYLYVYNIVKRRNKPIKMHLIHFVPGLLVFADTMPFILKSAEEKRVLLQSFLTDSNQTLVWNEGLFLPHWFTWVVGFHLLLYAVICIILVYRHSSYVTDKKSAILNLSEFKWLLSVSAYACIVALSFLWAVASHLQDPMSFATHTVIITLTFLALNFMLFEKPDILYGLNPKNVAPVIDESNKEEQKYIPFEEPQMSLYAEQLKQFMMKYKPFLNNAYSLDKLAQDTDIGRHHLSIVINQGLGMKYNEMINRYRIEYLIQHYRQVNEKNLTIEGIASEVGFNSRTTFLHSVKKFTGLTPTEFVKQLENNKTFELPDLSVNM